MAVNVAPSPGRDSHVSVPSKVSVTMRRAMASPAVAQIKEAVGKYGKRAGGSED